MAGPGEGTPSALAGALERAASHHGGVAPQATRCESVQGGHFCPDSRDSPGHRRGTPTPAYAPYGCVATAGAPDSPWWGRALPSPALRSLPPEACMALDQCCPLDVS